jgi:hypothetical protein
MATTGRDAPFLPALSREDARLRDAFLKRVPDKGHSAYRAAQTSCHDSLEFYRPHLISVNDPADQIGPVFDSLTFTRSA